MPRAARLRYHAAGTRLAHVSCHRFLWARQGGCSVSAHRAWCISSTTTKTFEVRRARADRCGFRSPHVRFVWRLSPSARHALPASALAGVFRSERAGSAAGIGRKRAIRFRSRSLSGEGTISARRFRLKVVDFTKPVDGAVVAAVRAAAARTRERALARACARVADALFAPDARA